MSDSKQEKRPLTKAELAQSLDRFIKAEQVKGDCSYTDALERVKRYYPWMIQRVYGGKHGKK